MDRSPKHESSILWVLAVLIALIGCATSGCSSAPVSTARLPPIPSHSDTNTYPAGSIAPSVGEVSTQITDNPSIRGTGTTDRPTARR
jgi:hypothetical protein